jgi:hypothetical protein
MFFTGRSKNLPDLVWFCSYRHSSVINANDYRLSSSVQQTAVPRFAFEKFWIAGIIFTI